MHRRALDIRVDKAGQKRRQQEKEQDRQPQRQKNRQRRDEFLHFFVAELFFKPLVEFARLGDVLVGEIVRRKHQRFHALDHRIDKRDRAADNGQPENRVLVSHERQLLYLLHKPLRRADNDGLLPRPAHQNAFNQRLSADARAELGRGILLLCFFCHEWFSFFYAISYHRRFQNATPVLFLCHWQCDRHDRAAALGVGNVERAAVQAHDLVAHGKADAAAARSGRALVKLLLDERMPAP